ncbi:hypothetical protein LCGC14_3163230, partial [marine sediment metagenome]
MQANPIFPDRNIGPQDYKTFGTNILLVTKIFPTIQGEGPFAGRRCVFIRLAGCNLGGKGVNGPGCSFCDTDFRFDNGKLMTFAEIIEAVGVIHPAPRNEHRLIVITGGEPMIQPNLIHFIKAAPVGWDFQIESNGRQLLENFPNSPILHPYLVVSPKVTETTVVLYRYPIYPILSKTVIERADCLKFVVSSDPESPYYTIPDWVDEFMGPIFVSPMAVYRKEVTSPNKAVVSIWDMDIFDQQACAYNHAHAAKIAMERG